MNVDHSILIVFIAGTLLLSLFAFTLVVYLITHKNKQYKLNTEKTKLEQEILKIGLEVQEKAINDISIELHDNIGAKLNAAKRFMHVLQLDNIDASQSKELLNDSIEMLDETIKDMRDLSHILNKEYVLKNGLESSLKKEIDYIEKTTTLNCTLSVTGEYHNLGVETELIMFRIAQELITNVIKHANASKLNVLLVYSLDYFQMTIEDNGFGFNDPALNLTGIGLNNIRQRVKLFNGSLQINSSEVNGTSISINANFPSN